MDCWRRSGGVRRPSYSSRLPSCKRRWRMYERCVCTLMCECKHTVCVNVGLLLGTGGGTCGCERMTFCCVWRAELPYCGCLVGADCSSYRPSDGGSLPLEPDWARLMYKFNSLSYWGGGGEREKRKKKGTSVCGRSLKDEWLNLTDCFSDVSLTLLLESWLRCGLRSSPITV